MFSQAPVAFVICGTTISLNSISSKYFLAPFNNNPSTYTIALKAGDPNKQYLSFVFFKISGSISVTYLPSHNIYVEFLTFSQNNYGDSCKKSNLFIAQQYFNDMVICWKFLIKKLRSQRRGKLVFWTSLKKFRKLFQSLKSRMVLYIFLLLMPLGY